MHNRFCVERVDRVNVVVLVGGIFLVAYGVVVLVFRQRLQRNFDKTDFRSGILRRNRRSPSAKALGLFATIAGSALLAFYVLLASGVVSLHPRA
jgi:drug/metabolite transporter (DMT)-like permease